MRKYSSLNACYDSNPNWNSLDARAEVRYSLVVQAVDLHCSHLACSLDVKVEVRVYYSLVVWGADLHCSRLAMAYSLDV